MEIVWLSGWASDLQYYQISESLPTHRHHFISFVELMANKELPPADRYIAWSLGAHFIPPDLQNPCLLVNPALDFCQSPGGWPQRYVSRMQKGVISNKEATLSQFSEAMGIPKDRQRLWLQKACVFSDEILVAGLEKLKTDRVVFSNSQKKWLKCLQGTKDAVTLAQGNQIYCSQYKIPYIETPLTHWIANEEWLKLIGEQL